jgi:hypothetical protein
MAGSFRSRSETERKISDFFLNYDSQTIIRSNDQSRFVTCFFESNCHLASSFCRSGPFDYQLPRGVSCHVAFGYEKMKNEGIVGIATWKVLPRGSGLLSTLMLGLDTWHSHTICTY